MYLRKGRHERGNSDLHLILAQHTVINDSLLFMVTRKCLLRRYILAPSKELLAWGTCGVNLEC